MAMSFLPMPRHDDLDDEAKAASDRHVEQYGGPITNLDATLLGHLPSFEAYREWFTLRDALVPYLGERAVNLLSYAISKGYGSPICSAYFGTVLKDAGEDLDNPQVTETEQLLIDWGRLVARDPHGVPDDMYAQLEQTFNPKLRTILVAFAGFMVALNLFTTVGRIPVDEALLD
jgi:hypothetical protein